MAKDRSTRRREVEEATLNLSDEQVQEFKAAFNLFAGGGERLDPNQLGVILAKFGIKADPKQMISEADTNKEGSIDFNQFASMMANKMAKSDAEEDLLDAFCKFDWQKKGTIASKELQDALLTLAKPISSTELKEFLNVCEKEDNGTLVVDYKAFLREMYGSSSK